MAQLSAEQHGQRQKNLLEATRTVQKCLFQHRIGSYLAGQETSLEGIHWAIIGGTGERIVGLPTRGITTLDRFCLISYHGHMSMVISEPGMTVAAGEFKARCLSLIDKVSQTRQVITITKRGKPVARLVPLQDEKPRKLFGYFSGHVVKENDIVSPAGERWEAEGG